MKNLKINLITLIILLTAVSFAGNFKLPSYEKAKLENGLTVYFMEQHEVPLIYISALIPCGAIYDGSKNGLAYLTSESLLFGTKNYTKKQIEETFEFYGASISASASVEFIKVNASFAKQDQEKLLPIFQDIIMNPTFPDTEVEKRKQRLLVELDQAKESPRAVSELTLINFYLRTTNSEIRYRVQKTKLPISVLMI
jgi:zinc protease